MQFTFFIALLKVTVEFEERRSFVRGAITIQLLKLRFIYSRILFAVLWFHVAEKAALWGGKSSIAGVLNVYKFYLISLRADTPQRS